MIQKEENISEAFKACERMHIRLGMCIHEFMYARPFIQKKYACFDTCKYDIFGTCATVDLHIYIRAKTLTCHMLFSFDRFRTTKTYN
jgi:hypothetical protein